MISYFSNFASSLVTCIIVITMIEMILPNNNLKKYVIFTSTIVLSIIIINPIISIFNSEIAVEDIISAEEKELVNNEYTSQLEYAKQKSIYELYDDALKKDIIARLESNGYKVKNMSLTVDRNSYEPIKMQLEIEHYDGDIQKVIIDVSNNNTDEISLFDIAKVKDILSSTYNINSSNIIINKNL